MDMEQISNILDFFFHSSITSAHLDTTTIPRWLNTGIPHDCRIPLYVLHSTTFFNVFHLSQKSGSISK